MRIVNLSQQTDSWLLWRQRGIGASDSCIIVHGSHFGKSRMSLWQEKVGLGKTKSRNWAMTEGINSEQETREWFQSVTGLVATPLCAMHDELDYLKASLDGWIESVQMPVEIKYARKEWHDEALAGNVPETYQPQLNHQLLVTGAVSMFYVSHNPRYPIATRYALVEYTPDKSVLDEHLRLVKEFQGCVESKTPPDQEHSSEHHS